MFNSHKTLLFICFSIGLSIILPNISSAQDTRISKGRVKGVTVEYANVRKNAIRKMRNHIRKEEYQSAARQAITFIKSEEPDGRSGMEKSPYLRDAYNVLCVASTALRKVEYAMEACKTSLQYNPDNWESLKSRATLYFMTEDFSNSLADFEAALKYAPADEKEVNNMLNHNITVVKSKLN